MATLSARSKKRNPVSDWLDLYRLLWEDRSDRLDVYLKDTAAKTKGEA